MSVERFWLLLEGILIYLR